MGKEATSGALAVNTGMFTGRSPLDRFIVKDNITKDQVWWGNINIPFESNAFDLLYDKMVNYLKNNDEKWRFSIWNLLLSSSTSQS